MNIIRHPLFRFAVIAFCCLICIGLVRSIIENVRRNDLVAQRQAVLQKEQERNVQLQEELRVATSASFLEKQAREKLGLAREGETIVLMEKPAGKEGPSGVFAAPQSLWKRWWKLFF
jgi:cell division protein FtsB